MERYYSFNRFLRQKFGKPVYKVCVDAGFSCPNLDGSLSSKGCIFCNNDSFGPSRRLHHLSIERQIEEGVRRQRNRTGASAFLAYFQNFTNTYASIAILKESYEKALTCDGVVGLNIATRPDCLEEEKLELIATFAKKSFVLLEFGLQSSHDRTLNLINRGHDYSCFVQAVKKSKEHGLSISAHVILGLPQETEEMMLQTAYRLASLPLDGLKLHDLHVVRGTELAELYLRNPFNLLGREEYIALLCRFLERLPPNIAIERLFSSTPKNLLLAPDWAVDTSRLLRDIQIELARRETWQGRLWGKNIQ